MEVFISRLLSMNENGRDAMIVLLCAMSGEEATAVQTRGVRLQQGDGSWII